MLRSKRPFPMTNVLLTACLGSALLVAVPAIAQTSVGTTDPQKTGVEPRGTKVAPSTNPGETDTGTSSGAGMSSGAGRAEASPGVTSGPASGGNVMPGAAAEKGARMNGHGEGTAAGSASSGNDTLGAGGAGIEAKPGVEAGARPAAPDGSGR